MGNIPLCYGGKKENKLRYQTVQHPFDYFRATKLTAAHVQYPDKGFYIMKFGIDNFEYINNFCGFVFGDQFLRNINENTCRQLKYNDYFVTLLEKYFEHLDS